MEALSCWKVTLYAEGRTNQRDLSVWQAGVTIIGVGGEVEA